MILIPFDKSVVFLLTHFKAGQWYDQSSSQIEMKEHRKNGWYVGVVGQDGWRKQERGWRYKMGRKLRYTKDWKLLNLIVCEDGWVGESKRRRKTLFLSLHLCMYVHRYPSIYLSIYLLSTSIFLSIIYHHHHQYLSIIYLSSISIIYYQYVSSICHLTIHMFSLIWFPPSFYLCCKETNKTETKPSFL